MTYRTLAMALLLILAGCADYETFEIVRPADPPEGWTECVKAGRCRPLAGLPE